MNNLTLSAELEQSKSQMYCSILADTPEDKKNLYNAMNSKADKIVADVLNQEILLKDVLIQKFVKDSLTTDEETGEVLDEDASYRVVLIDEAGKTYASGSKGLAKSLMKVLAIMGEPNTWDEPLKIKVVSAECSKGKTFTIEIV